MTLEVPGQKETAKDPDRPSQAGRPADADALRRRGGKVGRFKQEMTAEYGTIKGSRSTFWIKAIAMGAIPLLAVVAGGLWIYRWYAKSRAEEEARRRPRQVIEVRDPTRDLEQGNRLNESAMNHYTSSFKDGLAPEQSIAELELAKLDFQQALDIYRRVADENPGRGYDWLRHETAGLEQRIHTCDSEIAGIRKRQAGDTGGPSTASVDEPLANPDDKAILQRAIKARTEGEQHLSEARKAEAPEDARFHLDLALGLLQDAAAVYRQVRERTPGDSYEWLERTARDIERQVEECRERLRPLQPPASEPEKKE